MNKGIKTRAAILERSAPIFNTLGYAGASLQDLVRATGLQKGGLYNHYDSKETLALAAFDYAVEQFGARYQAAVDGADTATNKLLALSKAMLRNYEDPPVAGGCIVLNTAIESDDSNPALRERARVAMTKLLALIGYTVKAGKASGELRSDVDPREIATLLVAIYEGALMLSKLYGERAHVQRAERHMAALIRSLRVVNA
jgi:TetR/AcrR family transcriptional regulator, transcriptional repressor for nem operon